MADGCVDTPAMPMQSRAAKPSLARVAGPRIAGPCDEGANGGAVVSSVRYGVLDVQIEAASGVSFPARRGRRAVYPINRIGPAAIRILPDLRKKGEQSMQPINPSAGSWRWSCRGSEL